MLLRQSKAQQNTQQSTQQKQKNNASDVSDVSDVTDVSTPPFSPQCRTNCMYFPLMPDIVEYEIDEKTGIKTSNHKFICGYDLHQITSWYDQCPREIEQKQKEAREAVKQEKPV